MSETRRDGARSTGRSTSPAGGRTEAGGLRVPLDASTSGPVSDLIRRFVAIGLSGFFTTEGAVRKAFGDTVPQEWIDFVTDQSDRTRQEMFDRLATEVGRVLERTDVEEILENLLTGRTIEIDAKVRIGPRTSETPAQDDAPDETPQPTSRSGSRGRRG